MERWSGGAMGEPDGQIAEGGAPIDRRAAKELREDAEDTTTSYGSVRLMRRGENGACFENERT